VGARACTCCLCERPLYLLLPLQREGLVRLASRPTRPWVKGLVSTSCFPCRGGGERGRAARQPIASNGGPHLTDLSRSLSTSTPHSNPTRRWPRGYVSTRRWPRGYVCKWMAMEAARARGRKRVEEGEVWMEGAGCGVDGGGGVWCVMGCECHHEPSRVVCDGV
jgi:hypothetical protein